MMKVAFLWAHGTGKEMLKTVWISGCPDPWADNMALKREHQVMQVLYILV